MPVTNDVRAVESMMPPTILRCSGLASCQMAMAAAGRANIMIGKKPVMEVPADGSPGQRKVIGGIMLSTALTAITEPLEFSFCAGAIDYLLNFGQAQRPLWLIPIGL